MICVKGRIGGTPVQEKSYFGQVWDERGFHQQMIVIGHEAEAVDAQAVFCGRLAERGEELAPVRVVAKGPAAFVAPRGDVIDATEGFQTAVRVWSLGRNENGDTFYSKHGDLFVAFSTVITVLVFSATFWRRRLENRG